jgi:hypothetical protein
MPTYQVEMLWRCPACKAEVKGREKACTTCRRPKTSNEVDYMPGDTSFEARVKDDGLRAAAEAGADWVCRFCSSSQRKLDGTCAQCGAGQDQAAPTRATSTPDTVSTPSRPSRTPGPTTVFRPKTPPSGRSWRGFLLALAVLALVGFVWFLLRPVQKSATVESVHWSRTIGVERHIPHDEEGWTPSIGAENVRPLGLRQNGTDRVRVGSHWENYTVSIPCGETCIDVPCTKIPKTCTKTPKTCIANKNGFATCTGGDDVCTGGTCTGGGRTCSTKFCQEPRRKEVDDYANVPHMQEWYSWRTWSWDEVNAVVAEGASEPARWPDPPTVGPQERLGRRSERYEVTFRVANGSKEVLRPGSWEEYRRYAPGRHHTLKISPLSVEVVDPPAGLL